MKKNPEREAVVHPFGPIFDTDSRVLILGSFPSLVSREQNFYYANPRNRFWPVLSAVFDDKSGRTIEERTAFLHRHHVALWDVIASCTIHASSDASIQDVKVNDIQSLVDESRISHIYTAGSRAFELYERFRPCTIDAVCLPSTSPANARMKLQNLIPYYKVVRNDVEEG